MPGRASLWNQGPKVDVYPSHMDQVAHMASYRVLRGWSCPWNSNSNENYRLVIMQLV